MTTHQLATEIAAVLKPTKPNQLAVTVRKKVLVAAHLKLLELLSVSSPQPATENKQADNADG